MRVSTTITIALLGVLPCRLALATFTAQLVADIAPGAASSYPSHFVLHQGEVYFGARQGDSSVQLWATDGTASGTRLVSDIARGTMMEELDNGMHLIVSDGARMFFAGYDSAHGTEPWISDGTTAGTHLLFETQPGDSDPYGYVEPAPGGAVYAIGNELWHSNGTAAGTTRFSSPSTGGPSSIGYARALENRYWFGGSTPANGYELWTSDGTVAGTRLAADLDPGPNGGLAGMPTSIGSSLIFLARTGDNSNADRVFAISANAAAPTLLYQSQNWLEGRIETGPVSTSTIALFTTQTSNVDFELMVTDGTTPGTRKLLPGGSPLVAYPYSIAADEQFGYVASADGNLWRTDGTDAGTIPLTRFSPSDSRLVRTIQPAGDFTLFGLATQSTGDDVLEELWLTDGTEAGTQLLLSHLDPHSNLDESFWFWDASYVDGRVFFSWPDDTRGIELHVLNLPEPAAGSMLLAGGLVTRRRRQRFLSHLSANSNG